MFDDFFQLFAGCITFDLYFYPDRLETHLPRLSWRATGTPRSRISYVTFDVQFQARQLDVPVCRYGDDPDRYAAAKARKHYFTRRRGGVLPEKVQRLVNDNGRVVSDMAQSAVLTVAYRMNGVGPASVWIVTPAFGERQQATAINWSEVSFDCLGRRFLRHACFLLVDLMLANAFPHFAFLGVSPFSGHQWRLRFGGQKGKSRF